MEYELVQSPWVNKIAPIVMTTVAGVGVISTAVLAAKATPEAIERREEAEKAKGEPLTTWEAIKVMAPSYIPAAVSGLITLGNIGGLIVNNNIQQAKLAGVVASGNQIINGISKKYSALRNEVQKKNPDILKEFDQKTLEEEWTSYVKERMKKKAWCWPTTCAIQDSSEWGEQRLFGIEYGNGLADENGNEIIFFDSTLGDVQAAFYNLNGHYQQDGTQKVNDLFKFLGLPKTQLGEILVWDPEVLISEWETNFIEFFTEDLPLEDNVPEPAICTLVTFRVPPLAEGYAEGMDIQDFLFPKE